MYFEWVKYVVIALFVIGAAWLGYRHFGGVGADGYQCEHDRQCRGGVCIRDARRNYCTRECAAESDCNEGWRCIPTVERHGQHCVQEAE